MATTDELTQALARAWCRQRMETVAIESLRRLSAGASASTWSFEVEYEGVRRPLVLQLSAGETQFTGALGKRTQGSVQRAAASAGIPTPEVLLLVGAEDSMPEGFVSSFVPGETLGKRIVSDAGFAAVRPRLAAQCGELLARIHSLPPAHFPMLAERGAAMQLGELTAAHRGYGEALPAFELALQWLQLHRPARCPSCVVHGDFRNGNLIVGESGVAAVLDWEMSHLGDPMEDLGWMCMSAWRFGRADRPVGGFGSRSELFGAYERLARISPDPKAVRFWETLGTLKWGIVCQWFARQYLSGEVRDLERAAIGRRVAEVELDLLELLEGHGC